MCVFVCIYVYMYMCVCIYAYMYMCICMYMCMCIYSCVLNNSSVFKKVSKAQNPYFIFTLFPYTQIHWKHCTFYSESKHELLLLYKSEEKIIYYAVQKNSGVCIFLYKLKHLLYKLKNA